MTISQAVFGLIAGVTLFVGTIRGSDFLTGIGWVLCFLYLAAMFDQRRIGR